MIKEYIAYLKDNPQGYWFKARLYGWLVVAISIAILVVGVYIGDTDDAPGAVLFGFLLMLALVFTFGYWKGEKPRWQWGPPKDKNNKI